VGHGRYRLGRLTIICVSSAHQLGPALRELRHSMDDFYIGIDLEWRPDFVRGQDNPVAIMQLASSSVCLLLQLHQLGFPWDLQAFLRCRFQLPQPGLPTASVQPLAEVGGSWQIVLMGTPAGAGQSNMALLGGTQRSLSVISCLPSSSICPAGRPTSRLWA
jgi:hypothetical protein